MAPDTRPPTLIAPDTLPPPWNSRARNSVHYISSRILIHAPAAETFRILADPTNYHVWNPFCVDAEVKKHTSPSSLTGEKSAKEGSDEATGSSSAGAAAGEKASTDPHPSPNAHVLALTDLRPNDEVVLQARMKPTNSSTQRTVVTVESVTQFPPAGRELCTARSREVAEADGFEELPHGRKTYRLAWGGGMLGMRAERIMEVRECEGEGNGEDGEWCEYRTFETMNGALARVVKWMFEQTLVERFADWSRGLRGRAESESKWAKEQRAET